MKILFITAFPPSGRTAGQDYTKRLLEDMIQRGHAVDLIYAEYPGHEVEVPPEVHIVGRIKPSIRNAIRHPILFPLYTRRYDRQFKKRIHSMAPSYDMLYFDFSQVHLYATQVNHPCKVLMCHDVIGQKYARRNPLVAWMAQNTEHKALRGGTQIVTFSSKDSNLIEEYYQMKSIPVNFYLKNTDYLFHRNESISGKFCFYGSWARKENQESLTYFLEQILPLVKEKYDYRIIGGGLSRDLRERLKLYDEFEVLGFVDDPIWAIADCQALIAPLFQGAGVKVKVIDALTAGTPVIGTDIAFEGIEDNTRYPLLFRADSPAGFAGILNRWKMIESQFKWAASDEFIQRYNTGHFTDIMEQMVEHK